MNKKVFKHFALIIAAAGLSSLLLLKGINRGKLTSSTARACGSCEIETLQDELIRSRRSGIAPMPGTGGINASGSMCFVIDAVQAESPLAKAGLRGDDVVLRVNGRQFASLEAFNKLLTEKTDAAGKPNEVIVLETARRHGVTLGKLDVAVTSKATAPDFGLIGNIGFVINSVKPGGAADRAGLRQGDILQKVNEASFSSIVEFMQSIKADSGEERIFDVARLEKSGAARYKVSIITEPFAK